MIVKGGSRAGAAKLAEHLLRTDTNENIILMESVLPGDDTAAAVHRSLAHFEHMARLTDGKKGLYHVNIDPHGRYQMSEAEWLRAVDILEEKLNLTAQPRLIMMHEKHGRQHIHVVWQRTDAERRILISDSMNYPKHERAARQMEREFGHALVKGQFTGRERDRKGHFVEPRPGYDSETRTYKPKGYNQAEWQQGERIGMKPQDRKAEITGLWRQSDSGQAFVAALKDAGYELARGDKKDIHMLVKDGEIYDLRRHVTAAKKKDVQERLQEYPAGELPLAAEVKARQIERAQRLEVSMADDKEGKDETLHQQQEERKQEASRAMREAYKQAAGRKEHIAQVETRDGEDHDRTPEHQREAEQKKKTMPDRRKDEAAGPEEQDEGKLQGRFVISKGRRYFIPEGVEGVPIEEVYSGRLPDSLKGAKIYQTKSGGVIAYPERPDDEPGRQDQQNAYKQAAGRKDHIGKDESWDRDDYNQQWEQSVIDAAIALEQRREAEQKKKTVPDRRKDTAPGRQEQGSKGKRPEPERPPERQGQEDAYKQAAGRKDYVGHDAGASRSQEQSREAAGRGKAAGDWRKAQAANNNSREGAIRDREKGKFEEQANQKRAEYQSWHHDERAEMKNRHSRAMDILTDKLEKFYGPGIQKEKQILADIEKRKWQGGFWYHLRQAEKDQQAAENARLGIANAEGRIKEYKSALTKEQKVEEDQLTKKQHERSQGLEARITRARELREQEGWQPTPDQDMERTPHAGIERTSTERAHRPDTGHTRNRGGEGFGL